MYIFKIRISIDEPNQGYSNYNTNNNHNDSELHVSINGCQKSRMRGIQMKSTKWEWDATCTRIFLSSFISLKGSNNIYMMYSTKDRILKKAQTFHKLRK